MYEINIESKGVMGSDVHVTLPDGTEIKRIRRLTIYADADDMVRADLEVTMPMVRVTATIKSVDMMCPVCSETMTHECHPDTLGGS